VVYRAQDEQNPLRTAALDERVKELEEERRKFTDAAVRLGKERADLQAERVQFEEEKRKSALQQVLDALPSTPTEAATSPPQPQRKAKGKSPVRGRAMKTPVKPLFARPQAVNYKPPAPSPLRKVVTVSVSSDDSSEEENVPPQRQREKENTRLRKSPTPHVVGGGGSRRSGAARSWRG